MDQFIVNIIHRPEMVPEYAEKVTGQGRTEDILNVFLPAVHHEAIIVELSGTEDSES